MGIIDRNIKQRIKEIAAKHNLDLVVLFGSQTKGRAIKESDVDIGIFRKNGEIAFEDQTALNRAFSELFKNNNIDVVTISPNNPVLMFSILKGGEVLFTAGDGLADNLRLYAWKLLAESKSFRDHSFSVLKNRIVSFG